MSDATQLHCPACDAEVERLKYWLEDPEASTFERVVITRWLPCGHESRSTPKARTGPAHPDEEPSA